MKTIITLKRFYFKEVEIEIDNELLKGMNHEEIADFLVDKMIEGEDEEFDKARLKFYEHTSRYDIYDGVQHVYGRNL